MPTQEELTRVQTKYVDMLMKKPNVVGVAVGQHPGERHLAR